MDHVCRNQFWGSRTRDQHATDDKVGLQHVVFDGVASREDRIGRAAKLLPVRLEHIWIAINNPDIRTHTHRDVSRVGTYHACPQNHDFGRINTGHTAQEHASSTVRVF